MGDRPLFPTPPLVSPKFPHVPLGVGGWPLGYEERRCWAKCPCKFPTLTTYVILIHQRYSLTDGRTDGQTTCNLNTALFVVKFCYVSFFAFLFLSARLPFCRPTENKDKKIAGSYSVISGLSGWAEQVPVTSQPKLRPPLSMWSISFRLCLFCPPISVPDASWTHYPGPTRLSISGGEAVSQRMQI